MRNMGVLCLVVLCATAAAADLQVRSTRINEAMAWALWGDFNGDGLDDLLRHNQLQWNVGGRLTAPVTVAAFQEESYFADPADLNGDSYADVIMTGGDGKLDRLFLGDGNGGFTERPFLTDYGRTIKVADVTNDGRPDVVKFRLGTLTILRNNGDATFTLQQELAWPHNNIAQRIAIGDLNADGFVDLALGAETQLYLFYGSAGGTFSQPRVRFTRRPFGSVQIGDINGDGRADLSGLHTSEGRLYPLVLTGDGAGRFPGVVRFRIPDGVWEPYEYLSDVVMGDFIAGGSNELAFADADGTIFLLASQNGVLREVGRVRLDADRGIWGDDDLVSPRLLRVRFDTPNQYDLIAEGTSLDVRANPPRRVWHIEATGSLSAVGQSSARSRVRAVAGHADRISGEYRVDQLESSCPITLSAIRFEQEGMFVDVGLNEVIRGAEAVFMEGSVWIRLIVVNHGVTRELNGVLRPGPNGFTGTLFEDGATPCGGWQWHKVRLDLAR